MEEQASNQQEDPDEVSELVRLNQESVRRIREEIDRLKGVLGSPDGKPPELGTDDIDVNEA